MPILARTSMNYRTIDEVFMLLYIQLTHKVQVVYKQKCGVIFEKYFDLQPLNMICSQSPVIRNVKSYGKFEFPISQQAFNFFSTESFEFPPVYCIDI